MARRSATDPNDVTDAHGPTHRRTGGETARDLHHRPDVSARDQRRVDLHAIVISVFKDEVAGAPGVVERPDAPSGLHAGAVIAFLMLNKERQRHCTRPTGSSATEEKRAERDDDKEQRRGPTQRNSMPSHSSGPGCDQGSIRPTRDGAETLVVAATRRGPPRRPGDVDCSPRSNAAMSSTSRPVYSATTWRDRKFRGRIGQKGAPGA